MSDKDKELATVKDVNFDDWLGDLEEKKQPEACSIDNPDCEVCGS